MHEQYNPAEVEAAAQAHWDASGAWRIREDASRPKYYACSMLPYPSGKLHMGHVRNYTINDMLTRSLRMKGFNVLMPMGWDAFGLPAENAALKNGTPPARWTRENIAYMKRQMQSMGLAIDWSREIATCDPSYYKWNQWLFLKMLEKGIAYRKTQVVNWDPVDQTVLANEQVIDGRGWRTGALVEKREIPGYYLRITDYAQELLDDVQPGGEHAKLDGWPERVRLMQENWLGRSEGVRFAFTHNICGEDGKPIQGGRMYVFTTRADTIMGVTFCAVAPEHPLAEHAAQGNAQLAAFIEKCRQGGTTEAELALREKEGMPTGLTVTHPLTGAEVPLWVGNYVLMSYGDGAVMGVPAHDERDFAFARKYGIPIRQAVEARRTDDQGRYKEPAFTDEHWREWYGNKEHAICIVAGNELDGLPLPQAIDKAAALLAAKGLGEKRVTWRLRDWSISRQRYWGTPIPLIHCEKCGVQPVPEKDLPVLLPEDLVPDGSGNPLVKSEAFHAGVTCPKCGAAARRETDTMDTFVDSSWYFMRYCDAHDDARMVGAGAAYWLPMDQYIGGIEHAVMHLLYARFWTKVMRDMGLVGVDEPFTRLLTQGMVLNHVYSRRTARGGKEYFWPSDIETVLDDAGRRTGARLNKPVASADGELPAGTPIDYEGVGTMSKSKNNGVDPQHLIERYGADTARLYTMFASPPEATLEWSDAAVEGSLRFLKRLWAFGVRLSGVEGVAASPYFRREAAQTDADIMAALDVPAAAKDLRREIHGVLGQVDYDYQRLQLNTVVSGAMKMLNALEAYRPAGGAAEAAALVECYGILLRALYPATPHIAHALWRELGYEAIFGEIIDAPWPAVDEAALRRESIELMLQISGKLRGRIEVAADASKDAIEQAALASDAFAKHSQGKQPKKIIIVPGRLVNVVL